MCCWRRFLPLALVVASLTASGGASHAASSWAIAERDDASIVSFVGKVRPFAEDLAQQYPVGGVILYRHLNQALEEDETYACVNTLIEIRRPETVPARILDPLVVAGRATSAFAFVLRDDAVRRIEPTIAPDAPGALRQRVDFAWPDLRAGDVIGHSIVTELDPEDDFLTFPVTDVYPTVIAGVTSRTHEERGGVSYGVDPFGLTWRDATFEERDIYEGRGMTIKATAKQRPPVESLTEAPPYEAAVPRFVLRHIGTYSRLFFAGEQVSGEWRDHGRSWRDAVRGLALRVASLAERTTVAEPASQLGLASEPIADAARTALAHVRDQFQILEEPASPRDELRASDEILRTRSVTPREAIVLTAAMLRAADHWPTVAIFRDDRHGEVDEAFQDARLLPETLLVVEDAVARRTFHADPDATLPSSWAGTKALVAQTERLHEYVEAYRAKWIDEDVPDDDPKIAAYERIREADREGLDLGHVQWITLPTEDTGR